MRCQLRSQHLGHSCELRLQEVEVRRRFGAGSFARAGVDLVQRGDGADHAVVERGELVERHRPERGVDLVFVYLGVTFAWQQLMGRDVDVAQTERAVLTTPDERNPANPIHHRHGVGEAVQRVSPKDRILVDQRIGLGPVGLQPLRRDVQCLGKCWHAISPQQRRPQGRQQPQILAFCQRLEGLVANLDPFWRPYRFRVLSSHPVRPGRRGVSLDRRAGTCRTRPATACLRDSRHTADPP